MSAKHRRLSRRQLGTLGLSVGATLLLSSAAACTRAESQPARSPTPEHPLSVARPEDEKLIALCITFTQSSDPPNPYQQREVTQAIIAECGGPEKVAPRLLALLAYPDPATRLVAIRTFKRHVAFGTREYSYLKSGTSYTLQPGAEVILHSFWDSIPALMGCLNDNESQVGYAAVEALEALAYGSENAPWAEGIAALETAMRSPDAVTRRRAMRVAVIAQGDLWKALPLVRTALRDSDAEVRTYAIYALANIDWDHGDELTDVFCTDLKANNAVRRQETAAELAVGIRSVWQEGIWYKTPYPAEVKIPNQTGRRFVWNKETQERHSFEIMGRRHARLLDAMTAALAQGDDTTRTNLGTALLDLAEALYLLDGHGGAFPKAERDKPAVIAALRQTATRTGGETSRRLTEKADRWERGVMARF